MNPVILYRGGRDTMDADELEAAKAHFTCVDSRMRIREGDLVIGRYSVLPFYRELEDDLTHIGARLINSFEQHLYVADLQNWVADLWDLTPPTWSNLADIPDEGPFVLKGATNSKKSQWKTHMFAQNKAEACEVFDRLCEDSLISQQEIYIRQFVPLVTYFKDIVGRPVTKEFRFFVYNGNVLCGGYYWSNHADAFESLGGVPQTQEVPEDFLDKVTSIIGRKVAFYALDVAQTEKGDWTVIELNDGQMSGLSMNDPKGLYGNLAEYLK